MSDSPREHFIELIIGFGMEKVTITEIEETYSPQEIIDNCLVAIECLADDWYEAALTLKDLVIGYKQKDHPVDYRALIKTSKFLTMSQFWLFAKPTVRRNAIIYVMGKLSDKQYLPILNELYEYSKNTDPFVMLTLLVELRWLEDPQYAEKLQYLSNHVNYTFRLSCIELLRDGVHQGIKASKVQLDILREDKNPIVAAAACQEFFSLDHLYSQCKQDNFDRYSPDYKYQTIELKHFTNWLKNK